MGEVNFSQYSSEQLRHIARTVVEHGVENPSIWDTLTENPELEAAYGFLMGFATNETPEVLSVDRLGVIASSMEALWPIFPHAFIQTKK